MAGTIRWCQGRSGGSSSRIVSTVQDVSVSPPRPVLAPRQRSRAPALCAADLAPCTLAHTSMPESLPDRTPTSPDRLMTVCPWPQRRAVPPRHREDTPPPPLMYQEPLFNSGFQTFQSSNHSRGWTLKARERESARYEMSCVEQQDDEGEQQTMTSRMHPRWRLDTQTG